METQKERDYNAMVIKGMRKLLAGNYDVEEKKDGSCWHGIIYGFIITGLLALMFVAGCLVSKEAFADECADPALSVNTKRACIELVKICKEIGCSVKVKD